MRRRQVDNDGSPYALTLSFDRQIYHMLIRRRGSGKYSLGTERPDQHVRPSLPANCEHISSDIRRDPGITSAKEVVFSSALDSLFVC